MMIWSNMFSTSDMIVNTIVSFSATYAISCALRGQCGQQRMSVCRRSSSCGGHGGAAEGHAAIVRISPSQVNAAQRANPVFQANMTSSRALTVFRLSKML